MLVYVRDRVKGIKDRLHPRFSLIGFCPSQHHNNELFHLLFLVENCYSLSFSLSEFQLWGNFGTPQFISARYIGYIKGTPNDRKNMDIYKVKGVHGVHFPFSLSLSWLIFPVLQPNQTPEATQLPNIQRLQIANLQENTRKITNIIRKKNPQSYSNRQLIALSTKWFTYQRAQAFI